MEFWQVFWTFNRVSRGSDYEKNGITWNMGCRVQTKRKNKAETIPLSCHFLCSVLNAASKNPSLCCSCQKFCELWVSAKNLLSLLHILNICGCFCSGKKYLSNGTFWKDSSFHSFVYFSYTRDEIRKVYERMSFKKPLAVAVNHWG